MMEWTYKCRGWNAVMFAGLAALWVSGCAQTNLTNPARSATEQLLLSTAADRAMQATNLSIFDGKAVYLDATYFDSYDSKNALGTIRDALSRAGARMAASPTNSDIIVEARSGALSIDEADSLIGLPSTGLPIPLAGVLNIPEIALYKSQKQYSYAKFALLAYDAKSRAHYFSSGSMLGRSHNYYYKFLGFITYTSTDVPEKKKPKHHRKSESPPPQPATAPPPQ
jgi:hypothetical protein